VLASDTKLPYYNTSEAIKWFEGASNGGFINAHYQLGLLLESSSPSEKEQQKTFLYIEWRETKGMNKLYSS
jgi:TPR repeat protein